MCEGYSSQMFVCVCVCVSLTTLEATLIYSAKMNRPADWNQLSDDYPFFCSSLVEIDSNLIAMGGSAQAELSHGTRSIGLYDTALQKWAECEGAQLPIPVFRPGVVKSSESEVMVVGGELASQRFSAAVFIGTHTNIH